MGAHFTILRISFSINFDLLFPFWPLKDHKFRWLKESMYNSECRKNVCNVRKKFTGCEIKSIIKINNTTWLVDSKETREQITVKTADSNSHFWQCFGFQALEIDYTWELERFELTSNLFFNLKLISVSTFAFSCLDNKSVIRYSNLYGVL